MSTEKKDIRGISSILAFLLSKHTTFQLSHYASNVSSLFFDRDPWNIIKGEKNNETGRVYLGSLLLDQGDSSYQPFTKNTLMKELNKQGITSRLNVVQVIEEFEGKSPVNPKFFKSSIKSQALTQQSNEQLNVIGPLGWQDFKYEVPNTASLEHHLQELIAAHRSGEVIYFHCKSGVNRSFRMSALFLIAERLHDHHCVDELAIDDIIMETCSDIWDARPCVSFKRQEWQQQFHALKKAILTIYPEKVAKKDRSETFEDENKLRVNLQYELYRYRHHLKKTRGKYSNQPGKIQAVEGLIKATQYSNDASTLNKIHDRFLQQSNDQSSIKTLKGARNSGILSLIKSWIRFILRQPKTKGAKVVKRIRKIQNKRQALLEPNRLVNKLYGFFGLKVESRCDNAQTTVQPSIIC